MDLKDSGLDEDDVVSAHVYPLVNRLGETVDFQGWPRDVATSAAHKRYVIPFRSREDAEVARDALLLQDEIRGTGRHRVRKIVPGVDRPGQRDYGAADEPEIVDKDDEEETARYQPDEGKFRRKRDGRDYTRATRERESEEPPVRRVLDRVVEDLSG